MKLKELFTQKIRNRYRLIIRGDQTLKERVSVVLTPLNVILILSAAFVIFLMLFVLLVPRTPLKTLLPGYDTVRQARQMQSIIERMDSLERIIANNEIKEADLERILTGDTGNLGRLPDIVDQLEPLPEEGNLPEPDQETSEVHMPAEQRRVPDYAFFPPVKGVVTDTFDHNHGHTAIDIASYNNASVKSVLAGTVLVSSWTPETGNVMVIQHRDDLVSIYKHNSVLLKKEGTFVAAGEVVALVGNSGEMSTGPHLHFELWYDGVPLDPLDHIQLTN